MKVFPMVRESVFTGAIISKCVNISSNCCTRSCNCSGIRVDLCFLNTAVAFKGRFSSTLIFPTSNLDCLYRVRSCANSSNCVFFYFVCSKWNIVRNSLNFETSNGMWNFLL